MKAMLRAIQTFHEDEDGLQALEVVMIIAIAALVLIAAYAIGKDVIEFAIRKVRELMSSS